MASTGNLRKMNAYIENDAVHYVLRLFNPEKEVLHEIDMNALIGKEISMKFSGKINCISCGVDTKKSFGQGFCYKCFVSAPEASECVLKPELCRAHLGEGRDVEWEEANHNQPHFVYLAVSDVVKVGITRATQIPTRWIDQGAAYAIRLAEVPNRYTAGVIEVALKDQFTDRTNWRKMLKNEIDSEIDLVETKWELEELLPNDLSDYMTEDDEIIHLNYPVISFPEKVKSMSFDSESIITGKLMGIKGQYLLLDNDRVLNLRKHNGYEISILG
jgi:hypothetical protein